MLELDFENALCEMFPMLANKLKIVLLGVSLHVFYNEELFGRVYIQQNNYPVDVSAKMSGFCIMMTLRNPADWTINIPYLIKDYKKLHNIAKSV